MMRKYKVITLETAINLHDKYGYAVVCDADQKKIHPKADYNNDKAGDKK